jgi:hypothetical protein
MGPRMYVRNRKTNVCDNVNGNIAIVFFGQCRNIWIPRDATWKAERDKYVFHLWAYMMYHFWSLNHINRTTNASTHETGHSLFVEKVSCQSVHKGLTSSYQGQAIWLTGHITMTWSRAIWWSDGCLSMIMVAHIKLLKQSFGLGRAATRSAAVRPVRVFECWTQDYKGISQAAQIGRLCEREESNCGIKNMRMEVSFYPSCGWSKWGVAWNRKLVQLSTQTSLNESRNQKCLISSAKGDKLFDREKIHLY